MPARDFHGVLASTNTGRLLTVRNRLGDRLRVFAASSHVPALGMLLGGVGWMAGPACVIPRQSVRLHDLCRAPIPPQPALPGEARGEIAAALARAGAIDPT